MVTKLKTKCYDSTYLLLCLVTMSQKYTAFISDVHLQEDAEYTTELFALFTTHMKNKLERLFILGDLFDYWIGDDDKNKFHTQVIKQLRELSDNGIELYFIPGNRDFLIGKKFLQAIGAKQLPDPCPVNLYGRSMVLMHGDLLCTDDVKYLKFRKLVHNKFIQKLFLCLPLFIRRKIAKKLRNSSRDHMRATPKDYLDVTPKGIQEAFRVFTREVLIHGHTHKPSEHTISMTKKRIVLGAWHNEGSMVICNKNLAPKLVRFNSKNQLNKFNQSDKLS